MLKLYDVVGFKEERKLVEIWGVIFELMKKVKFIFVEFK